MKKIVIDPVTRIEGHLRVEVEVDENNIIKEAYVSGQLFRGIEIILKDKDPRDAGFLAGRICGVCTNSHYRASISAVEHAYNIKTPQNSEIIRDLMALSLFIQDHVVHFYHLHLLDFVDVTKALEANIDKTVKEAYKYTNEPFKNSFENYQHTLNRINSLLKSGKLGPFGSNFFAHSEYKLTSEQSLLLLTHYLEALKFQTQISKAIAIFGGKTPHPQSIVVGGVTSIADILNPQRLNDFIFTIKKSKEFIQNGYITDMKLLSIAYRDDIKNEIGKSNGNFLSVGGYQLDDIKLFESGVIYGFDFKNIKEFNEDHIKEKIDCSWYDKKGDVLYDDTDDKYSWIKSPRYENKSIETGPLSRVLITYLKDNKIIKDFVDNFLDDVNLELNDLTSYIGRDIARAIESEYIIEFIFKLFSRLMQNITYDNTDTWTQYQFEELKKDTKGRAFFEVPRGTLSHFINIKDQKINNYSVIAPTTWNASPKTADGIRGAYEEALIGLKIADIDKPLEILRIIHSFDPCIACAVHIIDTKNKNLEKFKV